MPSGPRLPLIPSSPCCGLTQKECEVPSVSGRHEGCSPPSRIAALCLGRRSGLPGELVGPILALRVSRPVVPTSTAQSPVSTLGILLHPAGHPPCAPATSCTALLCAALRRKRTQRQGSIYPGFRPVRLGWPVRSEKAHHHRRQPSLARQQRRQRRAGRAERRLRTAHEGRQTRLGHEPWPWHPPRRRSPWRWSRTAHATTSSTCGWAPPMWKR